MWPTPASTKPPRCRTPAPSSVCWPTKTGQVNAILRRFHEDVASLRRFLVDEGFLDRASGEYWRSGGGVRT
ncbi:MAG: DUF2087 domain-containing protein [Acidimicrobiales bacterium]